MTRARHPHIPAPARDGFTLVEVLVVLVIITIGILPLALVQTRARQEVSEADRFTQAMSLAQERLEWSKGLGFANAAADSGTEGAVFWRTEVDSMDFGLNRVRVTVIFPQGGVIDTLSVASLVSMR
jgi:prepilin-type N-terminal cleavage/methylation domain-containing protein